MHLNQVIWLAFILTEGFWCMTRPEEFKIRRISSTNRDNKVIRIQKQIQQNDTEDDEGRKSLAQQVADGKYSLIQKELFSKPIKRPGIISYEINPEVPKDNVNNLGGLMPDEIWLAENHLLVLKGGNFGGIGKWPAIDNYVAPRRQVKIPQNPKIPPPFPIQLMDNGPIEFIKNKNGTISLPIVPYLSGIYPDNNGTTISGNLNMGNGYKPFPILYPPIGVFLSKTKNQTEEIDEDDPNNYYPPPYDFYYPKDNSSYIPAGPLVPGIVLPPPPDFFSLLIKKTNNRIMKNQNKTTTTIRTTIKPKTTTKKPLKITITTVKPKINLQTLPPDTPIGDWIPIPAPKPFYITINPIKLQEKPQQNGGWEYINKTIKNKPIYHDGFNLLNNFKPIIRRPQLNHQIYYENYSEKPKYFYNKPYEYETNTLKPSQYYIKTTQKQNFNKPYFIKDQNIITTEKPPIYEYSYSAPGYGTLEAPKIGNNNYLRSTTTELPYYQKFNDITTKNYWNLFGEKLNDEITTEKSNYKYITTTPKNYIYQNQYYNNKFYYKTTNKPKLYSTQYYNNQQNNNNNNYYYSNYDIVKPGHSLETDINVNYKHTIPEEINPDVEFINAYINNEPARTFNRGSALISYELPGSGGHFYFLTPQAVK